MVVESSDASRHKVEESSAPQINGVQHAVCCIVGGGPGGAILALLLARQGISVVLLEAHDDFDRDFRGDTIHPSVLEILDELGLAERLHQFRHSKIHTGAFMTADGPVTLADFRRLNTRFPYIMMLPQAQFLEFITNEARAYPNFQLLMGASAQELIEEDDQVRGVRYRKDEGWHEIRALLTVGADGRSSRIRRMAGIVPVKTSPPMDILWFRLPRKETDGEGAIGRIGRGHLLVMLDRMDLWQCGYVIFKGTFKQIRAEGLEALRRSIIGMAPELADRIEHLKDWEQVAVLSVESSLCPVWHRPGLLLIGDAAHVMSPVGGVGINYAIQDAVVASNVLGDKLKAGAVEVSDLREVERQRRLPTRVIQWIQRQVQQRIILMALKTNASLSLPLAFRIFLRIPFLRDLPARIIAFGVRRVHVKK